MIKARFKSHEGKLTLGAPLGIITLKIRPFRISYKSRDFFY